MRVDVAILGAGGAGLALLDALCGANLGLSIAVIDPVRHRVDDRTWCFWHVGRSGVEDVIHRSWRRISIGSPDGGLHDVELTPFRYSMVRSADFYARVSARARRTDVTWLDAPGTAHDGDDSATVRTDSGSVRANWVFDSTPHPPTGRAVTTLWQHFRGALVEAPGGTFDPDAATLMDFQVPQPRSGLAFGYRLPIDGARALVEYTAFTRQRYPLEDELGAYLPRATVRVLSTEEGAIPMTDGAFARRDGRRVFRIGTAGGATRPATGYTFRAMLRQSAAIVDRLAAGKVPVPPRPYPRRHGLADAVLLRGLDRGFLDGPRFFTDLLTGQPIGRVLRFLDGTSVPAEELALFAGTPMAAMLRGTASYLTGRITAGGSPRAAR